METFYKGTKISYTVKGKGDDWLLFLHGWGGSSNSFSSLIDCFLNSYNILTIDLPPFGESESPFCVWGVEDYSNIVLQILHKEKIKKINIISHSFGSRVAIYLSSSYTYLVKSLVVLAGAGVKPKFSITRFLKIKFHRLAKSLKLNCANKYESSDYKQLSPIMKQTFNRIIRNNILKYANRTTCPTLLIYGKLDKDTPLYMGKMLSKAIKNSTLLIINDGGHFAYLSHHMLTLMQINLFLKDL